MGAEVLLLKSVDYLLRFLKVREDRSERQLQRQDAALAAMREAVSTTRAYLADKREGFTKRDRERELELSRAWNAVGLQVRRLDTPEALDLHERCFEKADYWADPRKWKTSGNKNLDIRLGRIQREIASLLG